MGQTFTENNKVTRVSDAVAAGTTEINSTGVAMDGFESVTFIVPFGAITAGGVQSVKAEQSDDDGSTDDYTDLEGSGITVADDDDNGVVILEIMRPMKRYVRCTVLRATQNSAIDGIIAIQSGPSTAPVTQDATTVIGAETHLSPAEGTA